MEVITSTSTMTMSEGAGEVCDEVMAPDMELRRGPLPLVRLGIAASMNLRIRQDYALYILLETALLALRDYVFKGIRKVKKEA